MEFFIRMNNKDILRGAIEDVGCASDLKDYLIRNKVITLNKYGNKIFLIRDSIAYIKPIQED